MKKYLLIPRVKESRKFNSLMFSLFLLLLKMSKDRECSISRTSNDIFS